MNKKHKKPPYQARNPNIVIVNKEKKLYQDM